MPRGRPPRLSYPSSSLIDDETKYANPSLLRRLEKVLPSYTLDFDSIDGKAEFSSPVPGVWSAKDHDEYLSMYYKSERLQQLDKDGVNLFDMG